MGLTRRGLIAGFPAFHDLVGSLEGTLAWSEHVGKKKSGAPMKESTAEEVTGQWSRKTANPTRSNAESQTKSGEDADAMRVTKGRSRGVEKSAVGTTPSA